MLHVSPGLLEQAPVSVVTAEPGAQFVLIPDAALLFKADFHRAGPDLVLTGEDGHRTLVQDYFKTEHPLPLMAPNGAALQPDVVDLLAGSPAANQYAQAGAAAQPAAAIGTVKTLIGNVSVVRNGVEVTLRVGDAVYKSDVIQTASGSAVGVSFPDGTALHLTANARMALSDYNFDANDASGNGALFNLVEGTFSFVAGQVAKGGVGMKIGTPVATMGIRGTTGWVQEQVATINVNVGNVTYSFAVTNDQGTDVSGIYDLVDSAGNVIATVSNKGELTFVTGQGPGRTPQVSIQQMTPEQLNFEQQIIQAVFNAVGLQGLVPRSDPGSGSQPPLPNVIPQNYQYTPGDNPTATFTTYVPGNPAPATVTIVYTPPVLPPNNESPTEIVTGDNVWIAPGSGDWNDGGNWSGGTPGAGDAVVINLPSGETVQFASGEIGKLKNLGGGTVEVSGAGASLTIGDPAVDNSGGLFNHGKIKVLDGAELLIENAVRADNVTGAKMEAAGCGSLLKFSDSFVTNAGLIQARDDGQVKFYDSTVHNDGTIAAKSGGEVTFWNTVVDNTLGDSGNGIIKAFGCDSVVELYNTKIIGGTLKTGDGGVIITDSGTDPGPGEFDSSEFNGATAGGAVNIEGHLLVEDGSNLTLVGTINNNGGEIEVGECAQLAIKGEVTLEGDGCDSGVIRLDGGTIIGHPDSDENTLTNVNNEISGSGEIGNGCDSDLKFVNESDGSVIADDSCGTLTIDTGSHTVGNAGLLLATDGGKMIVYSNIDNECGTIQVDCNSYMQIAGDICGGEAIINGGTLQYDGQANTDTKFACNTDGTLVLGASADFNGTVFGADAGDTFIFEGVDGATATADYCEDTNTLTVTDGFGHSFDVQFDGDYADANFDVQNNGGHAQVVVHDLV